MPTQIPKNLLDIRDDVMNVRLSAANSSLWSIAASMVDRVDRAINDAIIAYPFMIHATAYSIRYTPSHLPVTLPAKAEKVLEVYAYHVSDMTTRVQINEYRHVPTLWTNMLNIEIPQYALNTSIAQASPRFWVGVEYEYRQKELPSPVPLQLAISPTITEIYVSPAFRSKLTHFWPEEGFFALSPQTYTAQNLKYEIVWYGGLKHLADVSEITGITEQGFEKVMRGQLGTFANSFGPATDSVWISPVLVIPPEAYAVIILEAQANMYQYWVAHRSAYDQWAASSQMQQMDSTDILTLVATLRKQAQEKYAQLNRPIKKVPPGPTYMSLERGKGTGV